MEAASRIRIEQSPPPSCSSSLQITQRTPSCIPPADLAARTPENQSLLSGDLTHINDLSIDYLIRAASTFVRGSSISTLRECSFCPCTVVLVADTGNHLADRCLQTVASDRLPHPDQTAFSNRSSTPANSSHASRFPFHNAAESASARYLHTAPGRIRCENLPPGSCDANCRSLRAACSSRHRIPASVCGFQN